MIYLGNYQKDSYIIYHAEKVEINVLPLSAGDGRSNKYIIKQTLERDWTSNISHMSGKLELFIFNDRLIGPYQTYTHTKR